MFTKRPKAFREISRVLKYKGILTDCFETHIRFPKKKQTAAAFEDIVSRFHPAVINGYDIKIIDDEIWITEKVNNILFKKTEQGQLP